MQRLSYTVKGHRLPFAIIHNTLVTTIVLETAEQKEIYVQHCIRTEIPISSAKVQ